MPTAPSRAIMLFGTEQAVAPPKILRAGPLTVELENGNLRYIRYRGIEVLRAIAFLVRDRNWATYGPAIENLKVGQGPDSFTVGYDAACKDAAQELRYRATIKGRADGSLRFEVAGEAISDFLTNRAGFVVLHPLEGVAGEPVEVTHTDGQVERTRFPRLVSPAQPFFDIRALAHEVVPGVVATCTMAGDAYEMEDQRNWTDASYKTYIRPLAKPKPYTLTAGETLRQSVSLAFRGAPSAAVAPADEGVRVTIGAPTGRPMPRLGLWVPPAEAERSLAVADPIKALGPNLLVGHLDLREPSQAGRAAPPAGARRGAARAGRARDRAAEPAPAGRGAGRRRRGGARRRARARGRRALAQGVPQELAAAGAVACVPAARGDLRRRAPGLPGREDRRRHALLLHRAEPQAPAGGSTSISSRTRRARSCTTATTAPSWRPSKRCRGWPRACGRSPRARRIASDPA